MLTDAQLVTIVSAIIAAIGGLGAAIRWGMGRFIASYDDNAKAMVKSNDASTTALVANTASNAVLIVKIDTLGDKIDKVSDFVDGFQPSAPKHKRAKTNPIGTPQYHTKPRRDDES